ncbi:primosomal replication protein N [Idiomarina tyrosinivorans]|uniref:Replication restart protein PriB n=1 Tax=Idiomarina tyrosinivorans TaxID=1445662 RepID=A0A432ZGF0_9GAMM|nr:primosomal replication protein N [Idiomarina tyrosinivorans]RUO76900.1 primosomal replication protein N [Idiomarina tyrosinivorans]
MDQHVNQISIAGTLCKPARLRKSPAGIEHLYVLLEHRSQQPEAGLLRQCYVRIQVIHSGDHLEHWLEKLTVGCEIEARGFLHRHEDSNGLAKLVLHAQHLVKK